MPSPVSSAPQLRPAVDADTEGVILLIARAYAEWPPNVLDVDGEEPELRAPASRFEAFWVLEAEDGTIVGCVAAASDAETGTAELKKCYVAAELRGEGWGRRLVGAVEDHARARGSRRVVLWSDTRFTLAHAVYQRLGYRSTGVERPLHDLARTREWEFIRELTTAGNDTS